MKCKKCGAELPDNVNFCMVCGTKLKDSAPQAMDKLYVELIYNQTGIDIYSNNESIVGSLHDLIKSKLTEKNLTKLTEIKSSVNLFLFQYTKKFLSFGDDSCDVIISSSKEYLTSCGWEYNKRVRGFDTSKYKLVFTKQQERSN
jgi:hypothetical protein